MNSAAAKSYQSQPLASLTDHSISTYTPNEGQAILPANDFSAGEWFFEKTSAFYYNDRARLYFRITTPFVSYFALLKGLIEFTRPGNLQFIYQADQKNFEIDLPRDQFSELKNLLQKVHQLLLREIQFKVNLKKALQFEERYKREMAAIYHADLMGPMYADSIM